VDRHGPCRYYCLLVQTWLVWNLMHLTSVGCFQNNILSPRESWNSLPHERPIPSCPLSHVRVMFGPNLLKLERCLLLFRPVNLQFEHFLMIRPVYLQFEPLPSEELLQRSLNTDQRTKNTKRTNTKTIIRSRQNSILT
jgi:hypothetical protein